MENSDTSPVAGLAPLHSIDINLRVNPPKSIWEGAEYKETNWLEQTTSRDKNADLE